MAQQVRFQNPTNYSSRTLVGDWAEQRSEKHNYSPKETPDIDKKPLTETVWNEKGGEEDCGFAVDRSYSDNYTSSYDLAYNHFPKWAKDGNHPKLAINAEKNERNFNMLDSFGNITSHGLAECMQGEWHQDKLDLTTASKSQYSKSFSVPDKK